MGKPPKPTNVPKPNKPMGIPKPKPIHAPRPTKTITPLVSKKTPKPPM